MFYAGNSGTRRGKKCWHGSMLNQSLFPGPELRPDGRTPRVKSDIFAGAEQPSRQEPATAPAEDPFSEPFFASPSSPKPFIFRGTPDPYSEPDLFGSASTVKPFFPTVKSVGSVSNSPFSITPTVAPPKDDIVPPSFQGTFSFITIIIGHNQIIYLHC